MLNRLRTDLRSAWQGIAAGRWASVLAVLALAVGTGASATAAAVAYGGLLRPLPLPDASHLITLDREFIRTGLVSGVRVAEFDDVRSRVGTALAIAAFATERTTLRSAGDPRAITAAYALGDWFGVLGAPAAIGRLFNEDDPLDVVVLSAAFADTLAPNDRAALIGRALVVGQRPLRVVGILTPRFAEVDSADVWIPARGAAGLQIVGATDSRSYRMIGRVPDGASIESARAAAAAAIGMVVPDAGRSGWRLQSVTMRDKLLGSSRPVLLTFLAASLLVLFVACANVAMLIVNRAVSRTREFAVRVALGASRSRLVIVATLETTMLACAGALGGWWLSKIARAFLASTTGFDLPQLAAATDGATLAGLAISVLCVIATCSAAPLVTLRTTAMSASLRSTTVAGSRVGRRVRAGLAIAQLAMTVVLLTGAGLLGRTLLAVSRSDVGLDDSSSVLTLSLPIGESTGDRDTRLATVQRILDETRRLPGVTAAGIGAALPPAAGGMVFTVRVSNGDESIDQTRAFDLVPATDGYLDAIGARLVAGRLFEPQDGVPGADPVCVMSESALKHLAMVTDTAVGRELNMSLPTAAGPRVKPRVIGVIKDVRYSGLDTPAHGGIYVRWSQLPLSSAFVVARMRGDPERHAAALAGIVRAADPSLPVSSAATFDVVVDRALAPRSARFSLVGAFAAGAALLGLIGLSGALVRSVVERQRELAIRSAVGATPRRLLADVVRQGAILTVTGVTIGVAASVLLARAMTSLLYGVKPVDPWTYAVTCAGVLVVAIAVSVPPARRAAAADPVSLLRSE